MPVGNPVRTPAIELTLERRDVSPTDADAVATRRNQSEDFNSAAQGARSELSAILEGLATFSAEEWIAPTIAPLRRSGGTYDESLHGTHFASLVPPEPTGRFFRQRTPNCSSIRPNT